MDMVCCSSVPSISSCRDLHCRTGRIMREDCGCDEREGGMVFEDCGCDEREGGMVFEDCVDKCEDCVCDKWVDGHYSVQLLFGVEERRGGGFVEGEAGWQ